MPFMSMPKTCTIQTPNYRGRYHQKYLADPVTVSCEYAIETMLDSSKQTVIAAGWLMVPKNTDVTIESIVTIDGMVAPIKSVKMMEDKRTQTFVGKKVTLGS